MISFSLAIFKQKPFGLSSFAICVVLRTSFSHNFPTSMKAKKKLLDGTDNKVGWFIPLMVPISITFYHVHQVHIYYCIVHLFRCAWCSLMMQSQQARNTFTISHGEMQLEFSTGYVHSTHTHNWAMRERWHRDYKIPSESLLFSIKDAKNTSINQQQQQQRFSHTQKISNNKRNNEQQPQRSKVMIH